MNIPFIVLNYQKSATLAALILLALIAAVTNWPFIAILLVVFGGQPTIGALIREIKHANLRARKYRYIERKN